MYLPQTLVDRVLVNYTSKNGVDWKRQIEGVLLFQTKRIGGGFTPPPTRNNIILQ